MTDLQKRFIALLRKHTALRPVEITRLLGVSRFSVYTAALDLVKRGYLVRSGTRPFVLYRLVPDLSECVQESFFFKTVSGGLLFGMEGFRMWVEEHLSSLSFKEKISLYESAYTDYLKLRIQGFRFETPRLVSHTSLCFDSLCCLDLYTLSVGEEQKRTKPAVLLDAVKSDPLSFNKVDTPLFTEFAEYLTSSVERIHSFAEARNSTAVAFVPPTRRRPVQFMSRLKKEFLKWNISSLPCVPIERDFTASSIRLEQKSIASMKGRLENAQATYRVSFSGASYDSVLLVDDLIGSGATMNEVARKLKESGVAKTVHCLGLVGINTKRLVVVRTM